MNNYQISQKLTKTQKVFAFFKILPLFAIIIPFILFKLDPFCAGVHGDHMGCGLGGIFISFGLAIIILLVSIIGMIVCSAIIRKQKTALAKATNTEYQPSKFNIMLLLSTLVFLFVIFAIILSLITSNLNIVRQNLPLFLIISGILSIIFSTLITYFSRS